MLPSVDAQFFPQQSSANFNYRANWAVGTSYVRGDAVRSPSNGQLYVATNPVTGGADPGASATPPAPWASPFTGVLAMGPMGNAGQDGSNGDSAALYFYDTSSTPIVSGESYTSGTFTPPLGALSTIPDPLTNDLWMVIFRLDGNGSTYTELGLVKLSGPRGPPGSDGRDGNQGQIGLTGAPGNDGNDGNNGLSSRLTYRKTIAVELTTAPSVTYDGSTISLPSTDSNAWRLTPYISQVYSTWTLTTIPAGNTIQDLAVDESVDPNVLYVLNVTNDTIYRYNISTRAFLNSWAVHSSNDNPISIDVQGSVVRVLDGDNAGTTLSPYQQVYVYSKDNGGRQTGSEFLVRRGMTDPIAKSITHEGTDLYIVTDTSIRRFNFSGNEQTTGTLSSLGSDNADPEAAAANSAYLFILDQDDHRIYTRLINALAIRRHTKEWALDSANGNPAGFAITGELAYVLNSSTRTVYIYYNPDQPLWASVLQYVVGTSGIQVTTPFQMEGEAGSETITVSGTGTGRDGMPGANGQSVDIVFREVATSGAITTPTGGAFSSGRITTAPNDWHLSATGALAAFGADGDLYASVARLSGDGTTVTYDAPFKINGIRGPPGEQGAPGTAAAAGDSYLLIYQTSATEPSLPTGGTYVPSTQTFTPPSDFAGWQQNAYTSIPDGQNLYISFVRLPGAGGTVSYGHPQEIPRGGAGTPGEKGDKGDPGIQGDPGDSFRLIFREAATEPNEPTSGSWDGSTFRAPSGWLENAPNRSVNDPENLYATGVELPGGGGPLHFTGIFQLNGEKGDTGDRGLMGFRGIGNEIIFQVSSTMPARPASGSGIWDAETDAYTPPSGWTLNNGTYTGTQNLYAVKVTLPGTSNTETYGDVFRLNGLKGAVGERGPPGVSGGTTGSGEDGDSLAAIYRVSTTSQDSTIIGTRPIGGSWDHTTNAFTVPADWLSDIPDPLNNRFVYMSIVTLHGEANTISYDLPVQLNLRGDTGAAGRDGNPGSQGVRGASQGFLYQRSSSIPIAPADGTGQFFASSNSVVVTGYSSDPNSGSGTLYGIAWQYNPAGTTPATRLTYSTVFQMEGPVGQRGAVGPMGTPGTGGMANDGSSVIFMFQATSNALRTIPTGGTWDHSANTFTPPANWYNTYAEAEANANAGDPVYTAAVYLSGTADSINAYSHPIRMTGPQGPRGQKGDKGDSVKGDKGDKGDRGLPGEPSNVAGPPGTDGRSNLTVYLWADTIPSQPRFGTYSGGNINGLLEWSFDPRDRENNTEKLWAANVRINPDNTTFVQTVYEATGVAGADGQDSTVVGPAGPRGLQGIQGNPGTNGTNGTNAPETEIQYSIDGTTYHDSVANPYFVRYSTDGGVTWGTGYRFRQDGQTGSNGSNGFGYQRYYHATTSATVATPTITYNGSAFTAQSGWLTTIPTTPAGANIFAAPVRYQIGTLGQMVEGVVLFGTIPGGVAPPPAETTYSNGIQYGLATGQTPSGTIGNTQSFSLAVGQSHTTESFTFPDTTSTANNIYVSLPAGLVLTSALDSVEGEELRYWVRVGATQVYVFTIGFEDASVSYVFTVRRDN